jgi:hypothetical protein
MTDIYLYGPPAGAFDIILRDPTVLYIAPGLGGFAGGGGAGWPPRYGRCGPCPYHPPGVCIRREGRTGACYCVPVKVVARSLLRDLVGRYGVIEGNKTYIAMRANAQGPFAPGAKYDVSREREH